MKCSCDTHTRRQLSLSGQAKVAPVVLTSAVNIGDESSGLS